MFLRDVDRPVLMNLASEVLGQSVVILGTVHGESAFVFSYGSIGEFH